MCNVPDFGHVPLWMFDFSLEMFGCEGTFVGCECDREGVQMGREDQKWRKRRWES